MNEVFEQLKNTGIIPVIKIDDAAKAVPLAKALIAGGIPCAEVTFRTAEGEEAMRRISAEAPDILLGAGTVLTREQVDKAAAAGAKFVASPGFNPKVVARCIEKGIPVTPGCSNPGDIEKAVEAGLDVVKFFPAEQSGGLEYIKAVAAPYPAVRFIPTGGINAGNIARYLSYEKVLACGGSWMAGADLVNAGGFAKIEALCREAVKAMLGFNFLRVGINAQNGGEAAKAVRLFETLFGMAPAESGAESVFSGEGIEIMKTGSRGAKGRLVIGTVNVGRAAHFLEKRGVALSDEDAVFDGDGGYKAVYLADEIAGFAVRLVQKK
ncbi:MAG: bifunctional 4-hydroxy-2-oxoglutarate aldolase/2-dehydro-3-deoxy-phosphogluconate aldolase [Treponema sp.]|jgi:2-dehydro-3-deoxyphosphogluconate aldolase/(4S)-4-hydroxy-2-oxoglutarate aldolase|nr:bifunctional 4-hydroxy-2-oxoglutarate aldolase/2-dehydro-3-deoxy-phosphogluconate aldolase [Treponema sp.]